MRSSVIICFCNGKKRFFNHSFTFIQFYIIPLKFYFVNLFDAGQLWRALFILNCFLSWSSLCETPQALNYQTYHHDYITKGLKDLNGFEFGFEIKFEYKFSFYRFEQLSLKACGEQQVNFYHFAYFWTLKNL